MCESRFRERARNVLIYQACKQVISQADKIHPLELEAESKYVRKDWGSRQIFWVGV